MAKSSRSKWKKAHRREKALAEAKNVKRRVQQLNKKLKITVKGGISAVSPQPPEKRFHFLNPELDPKVPNTSKNLNNNYRAELNHVTYDYTKPLKLAPPKSNFHGKSDVNAPHPMTVAYDTVDADAPIAGHALTKADMARLAAKQQEELQALAGRVENGDEEQQPHGAGDTFKIPNNVKQRGNARGGKQKRKDKNEEEEDAADIVNFDNDPALYGSGTTADDDDGPEEYVFGLDDAAPIRVGRGGGSGPALASSSSLTAAAAAAREGKIPSMSEQSRRGSKVVATGGGKKVKQMTKEAVKTTRMASSTGKKAGSKKMKVFV